jgi:hypothetical protein
MAAMFAIELLTKSPLYGRQLHSRGRISKMSLSVSVLNCSMDKILIRKKSRGKILPRIEWSEDDGWLHKIAENYGREITGDTLIELALMGRAVGVELFDDDSEDIHLGFNFLLVQRQEHINQLDRDFEFVDFAAVNLNACDPREALVLSEVMTLMGVENPYDMGNQTNDRFFDTENAA